MNDKYQYQRDQRDKFQRKNSYLQSQPQPYTKSSQQQAPLVSNNQYNNSAQFQQQKSYSKPQAYSSMLKSQPSVPVDEDAKHSKYQSKQAGKPQQKDKFQTSQELSKSAQKQPVKQQRRMLFLCNPKNVHAYDVMLETSDNRNLYVHSNTLTFHSLWFRELLSMSNQEQSLNNQGNSSSTSVFSSRKREALPKVKEQIVEEVEEEGTISEEKSRSDDSENSDENSGEVDKPTEVKSSIKRRIKVISVQDNSADLNSVLQIAYLPGQLSITLENVDGIINIASKYQMPHILFYGEEFLCSNDFKTSDKFLSDPLRWAIVAKKLKLENFMEVCISELQNCIDKVLEDSRTEQLGVDVMLKVFRGVWQKFSVAYVECMKTRDRYKEDRDRMRFEKDHVERLLHNGGRHYNHNG